jgi:hypothetical protein
VLGIDVMFENMVDADSCLCPGPLKIVHNVARLLVGANPTLNGLESILERVLMSFVCCQDFGEHTKGSARRENAK